MADKNKGGRPATDRKNAMTVRLSDEAKELLDGQRNKSAFIDGLVRGKITRIRCPHCGKVFIIKEEE